MLEGIGPSPEEMGLNPKETDEPNGQKSQENVRVFEGPAGQKFETTVKPKSEAEVDRSIRRSQAEAAQRFFRNSK